MNGTGVEFRELERGRLALERIALATERGAAALEKSPASRKTCGRSPKGSATTSPASWIIWAESGPIRPMIRPIPPRRRPRRNLNGRPADVQRRSFRFARVDRRIG